MTSFEHAIDFTRQYLSAAMVTGSYSAGFLMELAASSLQGQIDVFRVAEEIAGLEGRPGRGTATKPPTQFNGEYLRGYWHKHHSQATDMPRNLLLEFKRDDTLERVWGKYEGQLITEEMVKELTYEMVIGNHRRRASEGRLTGEWIVYARDSDRNTYLTLAEHHEADEEIALRLRRYEELDRRLDWDWRKSVITVSQQATFPTGAADGN